MFLGDFPEDHTSVTCMFVTYDASGAATAPSSAIDLSDIFIYKNGNPAQKTTTNGLTLSSPFDATTGVHMLVIDTSNETGDAGFWTPNSSYTILLWADDETVGGVKPVKIIGQFTLGMVSGQIYTALNSTTYPEPGSGAPAANISLAAKIGYLFKAWRNRHTQTSSEYRLYADDASTVDQKAATADNGTTFSRSEITGP